MKLFFAISTLFLILTLQAEKQEVEQFKFKDNTETYHIKYNDTLARIALSNNVSVAFLLHLNEQIYNPDKIMAGQMIKIPNKKARDFVKSQSKKYLHLVDKMGAMTFKERNNAIKEMIKKDWIVIPVLLQALDHKDVEIRENAREALRIIHKKKVAMK